jgi:hypothetical protein
MIILWHLLVDDAATRGHPLHIPHTNYAAVTYAVPMCHRSSQNISNRLDSPMQMPREPGEIVLWNVVAEIVEQEEGIKLLCVSKAKRSAKMHPRTFDSRFRFD